MNNSGAPAEVSEGRRLEILLADYTMARDDERGWQAVQATILSVATAILGIIPVAAAQTCTFQIRPECYNIPDPIIAAAPLVPLGALAFLQALGSISIIRSYYMRALEVELQAYSTRDLSALHSINTASFAFLVNEVISAKHGRFTFRLLIFIMVGAILVVFGGLTIYIASNLDIASQVAMGAVYVPASLLLAFEFLNLILNDRGLFRDVCHSYISRRFTAPLPTIKSRSGSGASADRSLVSYLIFPRPDDAVKMLIMPAIFALLFLATAPRQEIGDAIVTLIVLWLTFELLVYSARYQWNDLRGYGADLRHPERKNKLRLPKPSSTTELRTIVKASVAAIWLRLAAAVGIGLLLGLTLPILVMIAVTLLTNKKLSYRTMNYFVDLHLCRSYPWRSSKLGPVANLLVSSAIAYEALRSMGPADGLSRVSLRAAAQWLVMTFGYAIRAAIAVYSFGIDLWSTRAILLVLAVATLGAMNVLLIWALEASSYCAGTAGSDWRASTDLLDKPHLGCLLQNTAHPVDKVEPISPDACSGATLAVLEKRGNLLAPWNVAALACMSFGTFAVALLFDAAMTRLEIVLAAISVTLLVAALVIATSTKWRILVLLTSIVLLSTASFFAWSAALVALCVSWPIVAIIYIGLRRSTFREFRTAARDILQALAVLQERSYKSFLGGATWERLGAAQSDGRTSHPLTGEDRGQADLDSTAASGSRRPSLGTTPAEVHQ